MIVEKDEENGVPGERSGETNHRVDLTMQLLIRCYIDQVCRCNPTQARVLMAAIKREALRQRLRRRFLQNRRAGKGIAAITEDALLL